MNKPTIIALQRGSVKLKVQLWGPCSPERLAKEKEIAKHRLEQLAYVRPKVWDYYDDV